MTVGQGDSRNKIETGKDIIRVPPPVDISSAPSHALAGNDYIFIHFLYFFYTFMRFEC